MKSKRVEWMLRLWFLLVGVVLGLIGGLVLGMKVPSSPVIVTKVALPPTRTPATMKAFVPVCASPTAAPPTATMTASPSPTMPLPTITPTPKVLHYIFPVQPASVASYRQGHHDYPATDIFAPRGSAFVAVVDGVVDFVSYEDRWDPVVDDPATRGGRSVAIIGDDGVRYYGSHLMAIAPGIRPGVRVCAGRLLGFTGDAGNARGLPHLHFGISHPTYPEDWKTRRGEIDPYPYLKAWQEGKDITPVLKP